MLAQHLLSQDSSQYGLGFVGVSATAFIAGFDITSAAAFAVILPALVMLLVNLPKVARECLLFYREYKRPQSNSDNADQDS